MLQFEQMFWSWLDVNVEPVQAVHFPLVIEVPAAQ